ncbi:three-Cys-motif partner protein TcmP [Micromonospora chokoriensis]
MEPHTKAKHLIMQRYLGGWYPILGKYNGRVVFFDGFAGPGVYNTGDEGSPVVALKTLLDHPFRPRLECEFVFMFVEPEKDRAESLRDAISDLEKEYGGFPKNIKCAVFNTTFTDKAQEIVGLLTEQKKKLAPTFGFIDPFGFSGVPINLISQLLAFEKCEIFFNFMYDNINRFATAGNVDHHLEELFGSADYRNVKGLKPADRIEFLHQLYDDQLRQICGFPYVQRFHMYRTDGHIVYTLFFGTRNLAGLRVMKDAMWKVDPGGGNCFHDRFAGVDVLFGDTVDPEPLKLDLSRHFAGRAVSVAEIEEYTLINTPYSASHWNRLALNPLEKAGKIEVVSSTRKKRFTFPPGTVVRFL